MSMVDTIAAFFEDSLARHGVQFADMEGTLDDATAALRAMETPTEAMIDRFVSRALQVSIGGGYTWSDYARDQWKAMIAGAFDADRAAVAEGEE